MQHELTRVPGMLYDNVNSTKRVNNKLMKQMSIDILFITYNRPDYTKLSLKRLLDTCDDTMRVWVWHNGTDQKTLDVVQSFRDHPNFFEFYHSIENKKLNEPTNWLWKNAPGDFLGKVDDDCLMPSGWANVLREAHVDVPQFGVIGCWHYFEEDIIPEYANKRIVRYNGQHQLLQNCWIGGSGYLMKRQCVKDMGLLQANRNFTNYCIRLAAKGWVNGWYYPFIYQDHMDDPRSPNTGLKTDEDLKKHLPLTAKNTGSYSLTDWLDFLHKDALVLQSANLDPKYYLGLRAKIRKFRERIFPLKSSIIKESEKI